MADVRPQPAARLDRRSRVVLPLGHRARHHHGLRVADAGRDGVRLFRDRSGAQASADRPALGLARICPGRDRHGHGDRPGRPRACLGALHLLPAADRQSVLLHRGRPRGRRLVDLGRADVGQSVPLEAAEPRSAGALRDVRDGRRLLSLGLDRGRRRARTAVPDHPRGARLAQHDRRRVSRASSSPGRCTRSSISG